MDDNIKTGFLPRENPDSLATSELSINSLRRKPLVRWSLSIALLFFIFVFSFGEEQLTGLRLWMTLALVLFAAFMMVGLWGRAAVSHFAFRVSAAMIFASYSWYFIFEVFFTDTPFRLFESRGDTSPRNALLGLVLIGLPCLLFAIKGRKPHDHETSLREAHRSDVH